MPWNAAADLDGRHENRKVRLIAEKKGKWDRKLGARPSFQVE